MAKKIRIFEVISAAANMRVSANKTWYRNLYEPLVEMGHDVVLFPAERGELAMAGEDALLRADFSQELLESYRKEHAKKPFDLFFAYLKDGMVEPEVIKEIRRTGVLSCNFSCNNVHQFHLVERLAPEFDYCLHSEKMVQEKFRRIGANPVWWPMASNPRYFKPKDQGKSIGASFVGGNYGIRARYIHYLLENGVDVHAYGPGWQGGASTPFRSEAKRYLYILQSLLSRSTEKQTLASSRLADHDLRRLVSRRFPGNVHPPVSDNDLIGLYAISKISLGFLEVYDNHDPSQGILRHLHLRDFEAPMCGALYCTGYSDELAEMFEPGKEIITYLDAGELLEKTKYYLAHEAQCDSIRVAGHNRALKDHTYQRRFSQLFKELGLG